MDSITKGSSTNQRLPKNFWDWITSSYSSVDGMAKRRQIQITTVVSLFFAFLNILLGIINIYQPVSTLLIINGIPFLVAIISFLIVKTRFFVIGNFFILIGIFSAVYLNIINHSLFVSDGIIFLIPIILTFASFLVTPSSLLILTGINLSAIIFLPWVGISLPQNISTIIGFITAFGIVLIFVSKMWNDIEESQTTKLWKISQEATEIRKNLQKRVEERTVLLDRRTTRLEAAALVTRAASEIRDLKVLLDTISKQISEQFGFYHVGIFLADDNFVQLRLVAASSSAGEKMLARGHRLAIGRQGIVGFAAQQKRPRIAQNIGLDAVFFNNPDLPSTRSEAALPLISQDRLIGILDIQSEEENAFTSEDVSILQTMTDQIAMAIENIRLVEQSQMALQNLATLNSENLVTAWNYRFGNQTRGFVYTPLGIKPISEKDFTEKSENESGQKLDIPLMLHGKNIGELSLVRNSTESSWSQAEKDIAQEISLQISLALENARLLEESQNRAVREKTINEFSYRFSRSLDIDTLLQNAVKEIYRLPQVAQVSLYVTPSGEHKEKE